MITESKCTFQARIKINDLKIGHAQYIDKPVSVGGWVRTMRKQKTFCFIEINDGSCLSNMQIIMDSSLDSYEELIANMTTGTSLFVQATAVKSPAQEQAIELKAEGITILGRAPNDYILQKKRHSFEFLRNWPHLRVRSNTFGAIARVRSTLAQATHQFFSQNDFYYVQTPILTASDCEGAGELFQVTTLELDKLSKQNQAVDYNQDFFAKKCYLTVSGQLNAETYATALSNVYTFGPTFRAENSNTSRHLAEFWMIEPEIAFANLEMTMDLAEKYVKFLTHHVLENCKEDITFFNKFIDKTLLARLEALTQDPFEKITYTAAINLLIENNKGFEYEPVYGSDLQSEHEKFLTDHFKKPTFVYNWPREIKPFYMRENEDNKTVGAFDLIVPGIGELIGGSAREDRLERLEKKMKEHNMDLQDYEWYTDLRKYGSVPHAGFGLGFERLVQFITGMSNIRDTIAFARTPGHIPC
jgi:asparaginyl-tRNA synthetase